MKHLFLFFFIVLVWANYSEAQTYANIPGPENVLVVYKQPSGPNDTLGNTSKDVMEYYQQVRGIPAENIVGLTDLTPQNVTIDGTTHHVKLTQVTDIVQDTIQNFYEAPTPTRHAWKYFVDNIANPIKNHLINNNLLSTIRYIVLCKGVPFKIQARGDWSAGME